ncbi:MAG TPA: nitroreductase family protein [Acidimicrobiales bacterium]|nr:nitroreductase family protein [Acidimicrobiales bacterium]
MPFDLAQTDRLLTTTRSVRKRLDLSRPVPREVVLECLELALQAPTGGNTQRWRWMVVDDVDLRRELADLYRRSWGPYIKARREEFAAAGRGPNENIIDSSDYLAQHLHEVPVHVIPIALDRIPEGTDHGTVSGYFGSIIPAAWSFMLALRSRGLGSAWTTLHLAYEREAAQLLGIPDSVTQIALLPVAYTIGDEFKPARRKPAADVTYWNQWGEKTHR